ncbi:MAG: hydroxyethylthiazole kinase [Candidatus Aminicenantes bacterium]
MAGEKAAANVQAPGSFQIALLDALYSIDKEQLEEGAKISLQ